MNPCVNGSCTDKLGGYTCSCDIGFKGSNCDINIDDCVAHACQNNATCIDEVNAYSCSCDYDYTGELCEIAMGMYFSEPSFSINLIHNSLERDNKMVA